MLESRAPIALLNAEFERLNAEKAQIETELASLAVPLNVVALHPEAVARYLKNISDLAGMLRAGEGTSEAAGVLRELVESVTVTPAAKGEPPRIDLQCRLEALMGSDGMAFKVVAGTGVEPATYGL
jgi:hypothetical protein